MVSAHDGILSIVVGSLLAGAFLTDRPLLPYLSFLPPPPPKHAIPFSWPTFFLIADSAAIWVAPCPVRIISSAGNTDSRTTAPLRFRSHFSDTASGRAFEDDAVRAAKRNGRDDIETDRLNLPCSSPNRASAIVMSRCDLCASGNEV